MQLYFIHVYIAPTSAVSIYTSSELSTSEIQETHRKQCKTIASVQKTWLKFLKGYIGQGKHLEANVKFDWQPAADGDGRGTVHLLHLVPGSSTLYQLQPATQVFRALQWSKSRCFWKGKLLAQSGCVSAVKEDGFAGESASPVKDKVLKAAYVDRFCNTYFWALIKEHLNI